MIYYIKSYKGSNAYYAKSTLIATSMWKSTDAWRGYSEIVPEPDFKKIDEGAVTGDWEDAPSGTSSREVLNEFKKLEKKYGTIYVILTETSNLFMQGYDVLIRTNATNNKYLIDNGGYLTRTTKERINRYLPKGQVFQKNFEWYYQNGNDVRKIEQVLTI